MEIKTHRARLQVDPAVPLQRLVIGVADGSSGRFKAALLVLPSDKLKAKAALAKVAGVESVGVGEPRGSLVITLKPRGSTTLADLRGAANAAGVTLADVGGAEALLASWQGQGGAAACPL